MLGSRKSIGRSKSSGASPITPRKTSSTTGTTMVISTASKRRTVSRIPLLVRAMSGDMLLTAGAGLLLTDLMSRQSQEHVFQRLVPGSQLVEQNPALACPRRELCQQRDWIGRFDDVGAALRLTDVTCRGERLQLTGIQ